MISKELLKGSTATLILSLLNHRAMYGYEMIGEIERHAGGVFAFKEGTLYPILHTLEAEGMVTSFWSDDPGARRRKYYEITEPGRTLLRARRHEWAAFRTVVDRILGVGQA